jgi:hypothetical protein
LDNLSKDHGLDIGWPPILSKKEELQLQEKIQVLADWGVLLRDDTCAFSKSPTWISEAWSLDSRTLPKRRWIKLFLQCHPTFVFRKAGRGTPSGGPIPCLIPPFLRDFAMFYTTQNSLRMSKKSARTQLQILNEMV